MTVDPSSRRQRRVHYVAPVHNHARRGFGMYIVYGVAGALLLGVGALAVGHLDGGRDWLAWVGVGGSGRDPTLRRTVTLVIPSAPAPDAVKPAPPAPAAPPPETTAPKPPTPPAAGATKPDAAPPPAADGPKPPVAPPSGGATGPAAVPPVATAKPDAPAPKPAPPAAPTADATRPAPTVPARPEAPPATAPRPDATVLRPPAVPPATPADSVRATTPPSPAPAPDAAAPKPPPAPPPAAVAPAAPPPPQADRTPAPQAAATPKPDGVAPAAPAAPPPGRPGDSAQAPTPPAGAPKPDAAAPPSPAPAKPETAAPTPPPAPSDSAQAPPAAAAKPEAGAPAGPPPAPSETAMAPPPAATVPPSTPTAPPSPPAAAPAPVLVAANGLPAPPPEKPPVPPRCPPLDLLSLTEQTPEGRLPRIDANGCMAWLAHAAAFDAAETRPRIGVIVVGLGRSAYLAQRAIDELPAAVSLGFLPDTPQLDRWIERARAKGHEVLVALPVQPPDKPAETTLPPLRADLAADENQRRLHAVLARAGSGYVGVIVPAASPLSASEAALRPLLKEIGDRGLLLLETFRTGRTLYQIGKEVGLPYSADAGWIDRDGQPGESAANLQALEEFTRRNRFALAVGTARRATIEQLAAWSKDIEARGLALTPVSGLTECLNLCAERLRKARAGGW